MFDTSKYTIEPLKTEAEFKTYFFNAYYVDKSGDMITLDSKICTKESCYNFHDFLARSIEKMNDSDQKIATAELKCSTVEYFLDEFFNGPSALILNDEIRFYFDGDSDSGALSMPRWRNAPNGFFLNVSETTHGDILFRGHLRDHEENLTKLKAEFKEAAMAFYSIQHPMFQFLTKNMHINPLREETLKAVISKLDEYSSVSTESNKLSWDN